MEPRAYGPRTENPSKISSFRARPVAIASGRRRGAGVAWQRAAAVSSPPSPSLPSQPLLSATGHPTCGAFRTHPARDLAVLAVAGRWNVKKICWCTTASALNYPIVHYYISPLEKLIVSEIYQKYRKYILKYCRIYFLKLLFHVFHSI